MRLWFVPLRVPISEFGINPVSPSLILSRIPAAITLSTIPSMRSPTEGGSISSWEIFCSIEREILRFSGFTSSTCASMSCPTSRTSFGCLMRLPAPSFEIGMRPSTPGSRFTKAPKVSRRTTVPRTMLSGVYFS